MQARWVGAGDLARGVRQWQYQGNILGANKRVSLEVVQCRVRVVVVLCSLLYRSMLRSGEQVQSSISRRSRQGSSISEQGQRAQAWSQQARARPS
jgi:hypothetical protein